MSIPSVLRSPENSKDVKKEEHHVQKRKEPKRHPRPAWVPAARGLPRVSGQRGFEVVMLKG